MAQQSMPENTGRVAYAVKDVATMLGVSEETIRAAIRRGHLAAGRLGERRYVIHAREVARVTGQSTVDGHEQDGGA